MQIFKYRRALTINTGTESDPHIVTVAGGEVVRPFTAATHDTYLSMSQADAYNGEVTVEDVPDVPQEPTQLDAVEAQSTYTAMMTETLLEG